MYILSFYYGKVKRYLFEIINKIFWLIFNFDLCFLVFRLDVDFKLDVLKYILMFF